jgi:hypothetical protein
MADKAKEMRESKLAQIRAMMARTVDNGCTEAEAKAAAAAVDRLLAKYEIDLDEVTVKEQEIVKLEVKGMRHEVSSAARNIAAFTDCKVWANGSYIVYFGFQVDTEIAEYLTLVFQRAIDRETDQFQLFNVDYMALGKSGQRDMLISFRLGMAVRLGERLIELKSKRDFTQRTTSGRDLVLIKHPIVDAAYAALGLVLGRGGSGPTVRDMNAYKAGRSAADTVTISQGIAGRAAQAGRLR